jgi:hypothetical protein
MTLAEKKVHALRPGMARARELLRVCDECVYTFVGNVGWRYIFFFFISFIFCEYYYYHKYYYY